MNGSATRRGHVLAVAPALGLTAPLLAGLLLSGPAAAATAATAGAASPRASQPTTSALIAAYASFRHIPAADVAGVRPGSVRTSYDPSTGVHRVTAGFLPSARDSAAVLLGFQDQGSTGVFTSRGPARWRMTGFEAVSARLAGRPAANIAPRAGLRAAIVRTANHNVGVGDNPASTDFSLDCNPFATLTGAGASSSGCGTNARFHVLNENQLWCADFAKWVWQKGGVSSDLGVLDAAAASFYQWALDHGQHPSFDSGTPRAGDAIVFYPASDTAPNASYADHVGLVVAVHSNGTLNLDNGDFAGSSNITVQANDDVNPTSFAADIWGRGEHWILVSPRGHAQ